MKYIFIALWISIGALQTVEAQVFHVLPTDRPDARMNIVVLSPPTLSKTALLVIPGSDGSEGRVMVKGVFSAVRGGLQYLYPHADLFAAAGITLVATGCPTDEWQSYGMCADDYRKSDRYAQDFSKIIQFLKENHQIENFYVFGHSSGGISSRWLSLHLQPQLNGAIHSSIMNGRAGNLAYTMPSFDMKKIQIPMLNIAHEDDQCPSTPYLTVKNYSTGNLVTVKGGGTSGPVCGNTNRHSFEGRQRGVARAIVKWMTTSEVQTLVETDD